MKYLILVLLVVLPVMGCVSHPALVNVGGSGTETVNPLITAYEQKIKDMQARLGKTNEELDLTKGQMEQLKNETLIFMDLKGAVKSLNFRVIGTIKTVGRFVLKCLWSMLATWFGDLLFILMWIMALTWVSNALGKLLSFIPTVAGSIIKALTSWMLLEGRGKIITGLIWALILSVLWKWTHSPCDWYYILPVSVGAWIGANCIWEFLINKTGVSDKVTSAVKDRLSSKLVKAFNL